MEKDQALLSLNEETQEREMINTREKNLLTKQVEELKLENKNLAENLLKSENIVKLVNSQLEQIKKCPGAEQMKLENESLSESLTQCREDLKKQQAKLQTSHENVDGLVGELRERSTEMELNKEELKEVKLNLEKELQRNQIMQANMEQMRNENTQIKKQN